LSDDDLGLIRSVSNLLGVAAWIMGSFLCYQPAGDDALNLYECLQMLLCKEVKYMSVDTAATFVISAFKAFIGLLFSYSGNDMFKDSEVCSSCITEGYFKDFLLTKELSDEEIAAEKARLIRERNERNKDVDRTYLSDAEIARMDAEPEVDEIKPLMCESLLKMFVVSFDFLGQRLKDLSL